MSPVFTHGTLRLYILSLLGEAPRHGYDLIHALTERFGGTYSPSAGTIYPRLAKLEEEGLVTKASDGRKSVYTITDAGRAELAARDGELADIETEVTDTIRRLASEVRSGVGEAMRTLRADLASAARDTAERVANPAPSEPGAAEAAEPGASTGPVGVHRGELTINAFRSRARVALRNRLAKGTLDDAALLLLESDLDDVLRRLEAAPRAADTTVGGAETGADPRPDTTTPAE